MKEDKFFRRIKELYGDKIKVVEYENTKDSSLIRCSCYKHGQFTASVHNLIHHKIGCPLCRVESSTSPYKDTEQLIHKLKHKYGDTYLYDKVCCGDKMITLICPHHGEFTVSANKALNKGCVCPSCKYDTQRQHTFSLPDYRKVKIGGANIIRVDNPTAYTRWSNMFTRCYNDNYKRKTPSYEGCIVCDEWKVFKNFLEWFNDPNNGYRDGYHLDKDLLVQGNKIYSPQTCCFIPQTINAMMTRGQRIRGKVKSIGVTYKNGKYIARCNFGHKEAKIVGVFDNEQEAFDAYKQAKERYIRQIAEEYFSKGEITNKVYNALLKYDVKQYDE